MSSPNKIPLLSPTKTHSSHWYSCTVKKKKKKTTGLVTSFNGHFVKYSSIQNIVLSVDPRFGQNMEFTDQIKSCVSVTERKMTKSIIFLVLIFQQLNWIGRFWEYISVFSQNAGKYGQEKTLNLLSSVKKVKWCFVSRKNDLTLPYFRISHQESKLNF